MTTPKEIQATNNFNVQKRKRELYRSTKTLAEFKIKCAIEGIPCGAFFDKFILNYHIRNGKGLLIFLMLFFGITILISFSFIMFERMICNCGHITGVLIMAIVASFLGSGAYMTHLADFDKESEDY